MPAAKGDVQRQIDDAQATHRMWIIGGIASPAPSAKAPRFAVHGLLTQATSTSCGRARSGAVPRSRHGCFARLGDLSGGRHVSLQRFFGVTSVFLLLLAAGMFSTGMAGSRSWIPPGDVTARDFDVAARRSRLPRRIPERADRAPLDLAARKGGYLLYLIVAGTPHPLGRPEPSVARAKDRIPTHAA
jgi:hypothetical protein